MGGTSSPKYFPTNTSGFGGGSGTGGVVSQSQAPTGGIVAAQGLNPNPALANPNPTQPAPPTPGVTPTPQAPRYPQGFYGGSRPMYGGHSPFNPI